MKLLTVGSILAACGLAAAAPSYHHEHHHHTAEGHDIGYAFATKHESVPNHHQGWEEKSWGSVKGWHGGADVAYHHHDQAWDKHAHDKHAKYEFKYGVKDLKTGDIKDQWEHRDGDHVKGSYSLKEADGTTRVVEYSADQCLMIINAVVKKIGHAHHPEVYAKPVHYAGGWEGDHGYDSAHGHGHDHGHASSYANVKQY
ncbi:hypothetical protein DOY81_007668 [Sarcophaga bullata]|nr:hypothetical protein DOY81_007668 [Sarcophaga bullata]